MAEKREKDEGTTFTLNKKKKINVALYGIAILGIGFIITLFFESFWFMVGVQWVLFDIMCAICGLIVFYVLDLKINVAGVFETDGDRKAKVIGIGIGFCCSLACWAITSEFQIFMYSGSWVTLLGAEVANFLQTMLGLTFIVISAPMMDFVLDELSS